MITCLSIEMHWAWAEAGCGYVHMYVRMRSMESWTQRNFGDPPSFLLLKIPLLSYYQAAAYLTLPLRLSRFKIAEPIHFCINI